MTTRPPASTRLAIVIPAFNEADRIGDTLQYVRDYLSRQAYSAQVLVVDDGSGDGTADVVERLNWNGAVVHRLDRNRGKGYAVGYGMRVAKAEFVLFCDADNATPFEQIERLWTAIDRADVAIGSRHLEGSEIVLRQPWLRRVSARVGNWLVRLLLLPGFMDTQCGFKLFRRDAARSIFAQQTVSGWGFDIEVLYIAVRQGLRVVQVPVDWFDRRGSKVYSPRTYLVTFGELLKIRWRALLGRYGSGRTRMP